MNQHAIELKKSQQLLYAPIYSLGMVELKTLKTYIETNYANGFIFPLKSPVDAYIFFFRKPDISLCLYMNYQNFNNLIIKN